MPRDLPLFLVSAGVYLERDGKILILERAAGAMIGFWSLPSGLLDAGESPEDGARRELFEESGLRPAGPLTLVAVTAFHVYGHDAIRLVYAADAAEGEVRLSPEHSGAQWIDPLDYRRTHLSDAEIDRWRARDPKEVSRSGQITLPRTVRAALGTDRVRIILENGQVRIEPSPDPGGSLQRYAHKPRIPFKQERDQAWEAVIRDKASNVETRSTSRSRCLHPPLDTSVP